MNRIIVEQRISDDRRLNLSLPIGTEEAGRNGRITIESVEPQSEMSVEQSRAGILATAGAWQGEFMQMSEGKAEEREPLS